MNAVEKALRHIEKLINARAPKPRKPAKRKAAPKKRADQQKPRVVSKRRRHKRPEPYNPPKSEPDFTALREAFAPPPPAYEISVTAEGSRALPPMTDVEALKRGILPNGELRDDWDSEQRLRDVVAGWDKPTKGAA